MAAMVNIDARMTQDEQVFMEKIKEYAFSTVLDASYEDAVSKVTDA